MASHKGARDEEDEALLIEMHNDLLGRGFDEEDMLKHLRRHFGRRKVNDILNGPRSSLGGLTLRPCSCKDIS